MNQIFCIVVFVERVDFQGCICNIMGHVLNKFFSSVIDMCLSAFRNQAEITGLLLSKGANINALNNGGCSTLHVAVNKQQVRCVRVLLAHKCDINIQVRHIPSF